MSKNVTPLDRLNDLVSEMINVCADLNREAQPVTTLTEGMVIAPHYRGYALLGVGQYLINHSDSSQPAELVISVATEQEKCGRIVGDERENPPGALLQPDAMAVRIRFDSVAGLDALENQLRKLRADHFP